MKLCARSVGMLVAFVSVTPALIAACSSVEEFGWIRCDPEAPFPGDDCKDFVDAGTDASDGGSETDGAISSSCAGRCVPVPSGDNAGGWSELPVSLWIGPVDEVANMKCPEGTSNEKWRLFAGLDAPAAKCDPCECGPSEGTCTGLPEKIEARAGSCGESGVISLPFDGPAGWDGSCTSENALPVGVLCGGEPCAQSVWASPLPGPSSEGCAPKAQSPTFVKAQSWKQGGLACMANTNDDACGGAAETKYCVSDPGPGWLHCVFKEGVHPVCPGNYRYARYELFREDAVLDDRQCQACECGPPVGSGCLGTLRLFDDATCSSEFNQQIVASMGEQCGNIYPPGHALGAKALTDLAYLPGQCSAGGGEPKGTATTDPLRAVTFCCLHQFYDIE